MPHSRGEPIKLRADLQNRLEAFALSELAGATPASLASGHTGAVLVRCFNASDDLIDRDTAATIGTLVLDPHVHHQARREPSVSVTIPEWPDALGRSAIAAEPIPPGAFGFAAIAGFTLAKVRVKNVSDRFAAPDSVTPGLLRSSDTGEFRIVSIAETVSVDTTRLCAVLFGYGPVLWRYKRIAEEWSVDSPVHLVRLDGTKFGPSGEVTLNDGLSLMDDQDQYDDGLMMQVGAKFIALNAPCFGSDDSFSDSSDSSS